MSNLSQAYLHQNYREFAKLLAHAQTKSNNLYNFTKEPRRIKPNSLKTWKRYILFQYMMEYTTTKKSDINSAEFGIYTGISSLMMETYFGHFETSKHYAFDSFEGLSSPQAIDRRPEVKGIMSPDLEKSKKLLKQSILHKGWIPDELPKNFCTKLDFIHIDLDLHEPIKGALEFVNPLLKPGAMIIIDDYSMRWRGAMLAVNEYIELNRDSFASIINHFNGLIFLRKKGSTA